MVKPKLSICCITFNQINYVRQALEGILMQQINFPFEIIIHDDASTDGTADIIREYEKKYPDIFKPIYQTENQYSKGKRIMKNFVCPKVQGEYVAVCEGDDYWTDPYKLQKQVDFLDSHPDFSVCFHAVRVFFEDGSQPDEIFPSERIRFNKKILGIEDLLMHNFIQTNSVMYRWRFNEKERIQDFFPDNILPSDWFLHLLHAQKGKIGFIDGVMADYRRHSGGIWWVSSVSSDNLHLKHGIQELNFHLNVYKIIVNKSERYYREKIISFATQLLNLYLKNKIFDKVEQVLNLCPECCIDFFYPSI